MTLGERIKQLREQQGLSQPALAEEVGVTKQAISKYEKGMDIPSSMTLCSIADAFNCSTDYLLGRDSRN